MDGDFRAEITVRPDGEVIARVIDEFSGEEFDQLRNSNYTGSFVNTVRDAYEKLLLGIARECCTEVAFASDQTNRLAAWISSEYGVIPDHPWDDKNAKDYSVFRHHGSRRWFALVMNIKRGLVDKSGSSDLVDVMNLKIEDGSAASFREVDGVYPAWHMNHKTWISVILDDTLHDEKVKALIRHSFELTADKGRVLDEELVKKVLDVANSIPPGKVASYGQIARIVGREKNSRMVGKIMSMADRYGDYPCHRVVNSAGRTVPGWPEQRELLEAEGIGFKKNGCVDMNEYRWEK
jgi:alkylated DNA nucleotide flippase Atl1